MKDIRSIENGVNGKQKKKRRKLEKLDAFEQQSHVEMYVIPGGPLVRFQPVSFVLPSSILSFTYEDLLCK